VDDDYGWPAGARIPFEFKEPSLIDGIRLHSDSKNPAGPYVLEVGEVTVMAIINRGPNADILLSGHSSCFLPGSFKRMNGTATRK
jgi:hypothetical protein